MALNQTWDWKGKRAFSLRTSSDEWFLWTMIRQAVQGYTGISIFGWLETCWRWMKQDNEYTTCNIHFFCSHILVVFHNTERVCFKKKSFKLVSKMNPESWKLNSWIPQSTTCFPVRQSRKGGGQEGQEGRRGQWLLRTTLHPKGKEMRQDFAALSSWSHILRTMRSNLRRL